MRVALSVSLLFLVSGFSSAQEWSRFRGPNGSGVSDAKTVPIRWRADDYNWKVKLPGVGHSSPVIWEDKVFLTCGDEATGKRMAVCLSTDEGKEFWRNELEGAVHRKHKLNSFASATPALDEEFVYVCIGMPEHFFVIALTHEGREAWRRDLGPFKSGHGDGVSPIVYKDMVVVSYQHNGDSALVSLARMSGEIRWRVDRNSKSTWSTPCVFRRGGKFDELIFTCWTHGITAVDPATGKIAWEADVFDKGHVESSISSPVVAGDLVLGTSGWLGVRNEVIAVRPDRPADKNIAAQRAYCIDRGVPLCTTPLVKDDLLFLWSDEGIVTCADVATGDIHWRKRIGGKFYSSPICVDEAVYNISAEGEVVVLKASKQFEELARNELGEPSHATPAVSGGVMYIRTMSHLHSIGGR